MARQVFNLLAADESATIGVSLEVFQEYPSKEN